MSYAARTLSTSTRSTISCSTSPITTTGGSDSARAMALRDSRTGFRIRPSTRCSRARDMRSRSRSGREPVSSIWML